MISIKFETNQVNYLLAVLLFIVLGVTSNEVIQVISGICLLCCLLLIVLEYLFKKKGDKSNPWKELPPEVKFYADNPPLPPESITGIVKIVKERRKQVLDKGYTLEHDKKNLGYQGLLTSAVALISTIGHTDTKKIAEKKPSSWHSEPWYKLCHKTDEEKLAIAGAWMAAAYDLLDDWKL